MSLQGNASRADAARLPVLGAIVRGLGFAAAARAADVTIAQVREIAEAAGWPDIDVVRATCEGLRAVTAGPARAQADQGTAKLVHEMHEYVAEVDEVIDAITPEEVEASLAKLQREYYGEIVATGPLPEHRETLEHYIARTQTISSSSEALPPTTDSLPGAPRACEVCDVLVSAEWIARTGRARHGHHPEGS